MSRSRADRQTGGTVELAHFWAEGDGRAMLEAVLEAFDRRHPEVRVADRSYDNHGLAIKSRILREDPPSLFVEWPDQNLVPYDQAGALRDLSELWADNGWERAFVDGVCERSRIDDRYVGVPVDIHRMNNLFYHVDLVEERAIDPGSIGTPREFVEVLETHADATGVDGRRLVGMTQPMKNPQTVLQFWATVFIGQFGAEAFEDLTDGNASAHRAEMHEALELVEAVWDLTDDDATFIDQVTASERFADRESLFFNQGDWMAGAFAEVPDFEYGEDWSRANFPGTDGVYMLGIDLVASASTAEFDAPTRAFLEFLGSRDALEVLNRVKGSIPPRTDVDMDEYPPFLREQHRDFTRADHFPAGHALEVTPDVFIEARTAMSEFLTSRDLDATVDQLVDAY